MSIQQFSAKLVKPDAAGSWTYLKVPFNVEEVYMSKSRVPVKGTINGFPFSSSLMPQGEGVHILVVNKTIRQNIGATAGDMVSVLMEYDSTERKLSLPEDFREALERNEQAQAIFESYSFSHQKEYIDWLEDAKKAETRIRRIAKAIEYISTKKRLKS